MSAISRPVTYITKVDFAQLDGYGIPADGLGNLGDRYYDIGAGRWYLKRWVVQDINGFADIVTFPVPATSNGLSDAFDISFGLYSSYHLPSNMVVSGRIEINWKRTNPGAMFIELKGDDGEVQATTGDISSPERAWIKVRVNYNAGKILSMYINGLLVYSKDVSAWNISIPATNLRVLSPVGSFGSKYCNLVVSDANGVKINSPFDDGSGLLARNLSWGGNGVLTTADVWLQTWVPMDLL